MPGSTLQVKELPDSETCWALLERIAASSQLKRAVRLQELLFYVGKCSLKDGFGAIHEQKIGVEVFGRPNGYDTGADNIVRTNVSDLRKRIEAYFDSEGLDETLVMEIPRGSYIPVFKHRPVEPRIAAEPTAAALIPVSAPAEAVPEVRQTRRQHRWMLVALIAAGLIIIALAMGCLSFWSQYRSLRRSLYPWQYQPSVAAFWSDALNASPDTDVVLADASFGLLQDINKKSFPFEDYLSRSYISQLQAQNPNPDMHVILSRIALWNLGSQDEFKLARRILALDPLGKKIHLYNARDYMPDLTKRDNVILIGGRLSNPWDELFEGPMNFIAKFDTDGSITVVNRTPAPGEQQTYVQTRSVEYCVVAYLPNPDHHGIVLLIEGTNAEATEAAGDFLLSEDQLSNFKKMLHVTKLPYFEALLKVSSVPGTPLTATIDAYRAYPNLR
jgi:hypothetical protein